MNDRLIIKNFKSYNCKKKSFKNKWDAENRALEINFNDKNANLRVYKCSYCDYFHLTSMSESEFSKFENKKIKHFNERKENYIVKESKYWEDKLLK